MTVKIEFAKSGRGKARCPSDPAYPNGIALPKPPEVERCCFTELPYPAPECGCWMIRCEDCDASMLVTAAGRADDPVSCFMPCNR